MHRIFKCAINTSFYFFKKICATDGGRLNIEFHLRRELCYTHKHYISWNILGIFYCANTWDSLVS